MPGRLRRRQGKPRALVGVTKLSLFPFADETLGALGGGQEAFAAPGPVVGGEDKMDHVNGLATEDAAIGVLEAAEPDDEGGVVLADRTEADTEAFELDGVAQFRI